MIKVLILGGGFGGVRAALDLDRLLPDNAEITLIDRNPHHVFAPTLYEVSSAFDLSQDPYRLQLRRAIAIPYSEIFAGKNINFIQADIERVDVHTQTVTTRGAHTFDYDYLILGLGSQTSFFGVAGAMEYAYSFKTLEDALLINRKIQELLEAGMRKERPLPIKVLIGGAGFTGIELAAELGSFAHQLMQAHHLTMRGMTVSLFEAAPHILPMVQEGDRAIICKRLTDLGVVVFESSAIEEVGEGSIKLKDGRVHKGDIVIWTAGVEASHFVQSIPGIQLSPRGKILVGEHLHLDNHKNIFAVGDIIEFIDHATQKPIPSLAYLAIDHGRVAAQNIARMFHDQELLVHKPFYTNWIAPIGGKYAVAHVFGTTVTGFIGWIVRSLTDLRYFASILPLGKAIRLFTRDLILFTKND